MDISCVALRKGANAALVAHKARHDQRLAAYQEAHDALRAKWVTDYSAAWAEAGLAIRRKVRAGKPITADDLPKEGDRWRETALYHENRRPRDAPHPGIYREPPELRTLIAALDIIVDETVSYSALKGLGVAGATLRDVLTHIGDASRESTTDGNT